MLAILLILALVCFTVEAVRSRSLVAGGLALWALSELVTGSGLVVHGG